MGGQAHDPSWREPLLRAENPDLTSVRLKSNSSQGAAARCLTTPMSAPSTLTSKMVFISG